MRFLASLRDKARSEGSANGRYGLLAPGFGDGGLGGVRSEFTNTVWVLAGLKAVTEAADRLGLPDPAALSNSTANCERRSSPRRARRCAATPPGSTTCPCS